MFFRSFQTIKKYLFFFLIFLLTSCASSGLSRDTGNQIDAMSGSSSGAPGGEDRLSDAYQNSSQATKGALFGGAAGALAGGVSGVGILPGAIGGVVVGGAVGAYIDSRSTLTDVLENRGVKIIVLGDQIMVVLFSDQIFQGMTSTIRSSAYSTLDLVTIYLNRYTTEAIKVTAYTGATGAERINRLLSQEQANNVVRYLWRRGINTRLIYAAGYGGMNIISRNCGDWSAGQNYRIEIITEKLPV